MEPTPTLSSLSGLWLKECEGLIFPETIRIYATMMQDHVLPGLGDRLSFTQEEVKAFLDGKLAAGMAESSVAMMERVLRRVLEYGHSLGLCEEPSWSISMGTPKSKKGVVILTPTEESQMANFLVSRPSNINLCIFLQLTCGLTTGEVPGYLFASLYLLYCWYMAKRNMDNIGHSAHFWGALYGLVFPLICRPEILQHFLAQLGQ